MTSRCFMFMYFLQPHWVPATWRSLAQTSIRAELPSGNVHTTRVLRRISRFSRSITLLVPVLAGKIAVGQRFLDAVLDLLGGLLQLHGAQLGDHGLRLLALLGVDRLEHFRHNFDLGFWHNGENNAVEMHRAALVLGVREHLAHGLQHPKALVADDEFYAIQAASTKPHHSPCRKSGTFQNKKAATVSDSRRVG